MIKTTFEDLTKEQQQRLKELWSLAETQGTLSNCSREKFEFDELNKHCEEDHKCTNQCKNDLTEIKKAKYMFSGDEFD